MRGTKAKAIRKLVYGDYAVETKYTQTSKGVVRCVGKRVAYQALKREG